MLSQSLRLGRNVGWGCQTIFSALLYYPLQMAILSFVYFLWDLNDGYSIIISLNVHVIFRTVFHLKPFCNLILPAWIDVAFKLLREQYKYMSKERGRTEEINDHKSHYRLTAAEGRVNTDGTSGPAYHFITGRGNV